HFGVPLTLALGLMRDVHGVIALTIPVSGDRRGGARLDVGAVIAEALRHAIVNALASPLRLLGAVVAGDDKVDATPQPIGFAPGRPEVDAEARTRVEQLGTVLGSAPALRLELRGSAGGPDVRALQEAAILADLAADRGALGTLRNLASRGTRNAIRDVLAARASGKSAELSPELQKTLDEWAAERTVSDGDLSERAAIGMTDDQKRVHVLERTGEEWRIYSDWPVEEHSHTELMTRLALLDEPATVAELVRLATGG